MQGECEVEGASQGQGEEVHGDSEGSQDEVGWTLPLSQVGLALALLGQDALFYWGVTHRASTKVLTYATLVVTCFALRLWLWFPLKELSAATDCNLDLWQG